MNAQDFTCNDGTVIPASYVCDGSSEYISSVFWGADCPDGSDEGIDFCCDVYDGPNNIYNLSAACYVIGPGPVDPVDPDPVDPETCDGQVLTMNDSFGDGWNGAELIINGVNYSVPQGGSAASACLDISDCALIEWTQGGYDDETSWSLGDIASGSNGSGAGEYGVCVTGCTNESADNYNADADISDDSLCEFSVIIEGCMDVLACNYRLKEFNDGSCIFAAGFDCDGIY